VPDGGEDPDDSGRADRGETEHAKPGTRRCPETLVRGRRLEGRTLAQVPGGALSPTPRRHDVIAPGHGS
jgi:hypothetical protein